MTDPGNGPFNEADAIKAIQRDAQAILKRMEALTKLKPGDADVLDKLQAIGSALPSGEQIGRAVDELRGRCDLVLQHAQRERAEEFRKHEAEFLRRRRDAGEVVREVGTDLWRVGQLELAVRRETSRARVLYNHEVVVAWTPVTSVGALDSLLERASKSLHASEIPSDALADVFWDAFEHLRRTSPQGSRTRIPLLEFFREVRVSLARHELKAGKPDRKLTRTELPRWAFLYNLDRYRRDMSSLPADKKLTFETGSQQDYSRGLGMIVNGLDPASDYKTYCYVYADNATNGT